jgi:hypothetical protein
LLVFQELVQVLAAQLVFQELVQELVQAALQVLVPPVLVFLLAYNLL